MSPGLRPLDAVVLPEPMKQPGSSPDTRLQSIARSPDGRLLYANRSSAALRQALSNETGDSTVVIVAQRVSTIRDADRIVVLDDGQVVGAGTHRELMRDNETYREIVLSQLTEEEANA